MNTESNAHEQLWDLIKDIKFSMFTTRDAHGHLHSRPMTTQNKKLDEDDRLWFFMSRKDTPVAELATHSSVNVSYADPDKDRYVSVSGTARLADDPVKTRELWSAMAGAWFPGGVDDPDLALVEVKIANAHFWDVKESKLTQLYTIAKAALTGQPPALGETGKIQMR